MKPIEIDEFFGIQNDEFRTNIRKVYEGYGTALSGRGEAINETIRDARPLFVRLEPVVPQPLRALHRARQLLPPGGPDLGPDRARRGHLRARSSATSASPSRRSRATRSASRPRSSACARRSTRESRASGSSARSCATPPGCRARLEPVAREIERSLPLVADAFEVGRSGAGQGADPLPQHRRVFASLEDLAANPNTLLALSDLRRTLEVATPLVEYVAPYQTVCNYATYWLTGLSEHVSEIVPGGTGQRSLMKSGNNIQDNRVNSTEGDRPADVPVGVNPKTATDAQGARPPGAARRRVRHGDRRPGQRRLRGRPARLRDRPERARRPLPAVDRPRAGRRQPRRARAPGQPLSGRDLQVA